MNIDFPKPLGATVRDVSPAELSAAQVDLLRELLAQRGVVHFPDQPIDDEAFIAFLRAFGELTFTTGETPAPGYAELNVVSNIGRTTPPRSSFHVDTSYVRRPPAYTALRAVTVPAEGGETLFTDQYRAYDTLPRAIRDRLNGRTITHVVTGVELGPDDEAAAEHPIFRRHPVSGRVALYMSTPARCASINGMPEPEARATIRFLFEHSTRPENTLRHRWQPGDLVMWDNRCVLHRADHAGVTGDRVMHRGMVAG
jgi:taurine dioxygenase